MSQDKSSIDRRAFLQSTAMAGLAGYAATVSAPFAAAADGGRYRIGVIGSTGRGNYGHELDVAWNAFPNCEIVGVADDNEGGREDAQRRLGLKESFSDYREMLDKTKPDIACVCPRHVDQHYDMTLAAAERGIHVYMEKPFVQTLEQADKVVAACEKNNVKCSIALWTHFSPKLHRVKQLIADGAIGDVLEYRCRGKEDGRGGAEDLWVLGIHVLDMVRVIGGHPEWCFANMSQDGKRVTQDDIVDGTEGLGSFAGNALQAMWGMPDGSTVYFGSHRSMRGNPSRNALQIFGSKGVIEIREGTLPPVKYLDDSSWSPGLSGSEWQDVSSAGIGLPEPLSGPHYASRHGLGIIDLLDAIETDRQPLCNAEEARGVTELILSVFESHRQGKPVSLPLQTRVHPFDLPFS